MTSECPTAQTTPHDKPRRRNDLLFEELDGEALLYDARWGGVHRFDALTLFVWNACDGAHSTADIAREVIATYGIDADGAFGHVEHLIAEFGTRDLLANSGTTAAEDSAEDEITIRPVAEHSAETMAVAQPEGRLAPVQRHLSSVDLPSRRAMLHGGVTKLAIAAPVIATFFAQPACASNPINPGYSPFGAGGCKNPGYSCIAHADCCGGGQENTKCLGNTCCVQNNKDGCYRDEDCCSFPADSCIAGRCL